MESKNYIIILYNFFPVASGSTVVLRGRHPPGVAAVPGHRARRHVRGHAARQLLPLHRHDLLLRKD